MKRSVAIKSVGPSVESKPLESRRFVDVTVVVGRDEMPDGSDLEGAIVRTKIVVPPDQRARWEEMGGIESILDSLGSAAHAYPVDIEMRKLDDESDRRVIEEREPEAALREYVAGIGLPEGDSELVISEGVSILQECELI